MYEITDRYGTTNHEFTDYEILVMRRVKTPLGSAL